jgi:hypothetical protein
MNKIIYVFSILLIQLNFAIAAHPIDGSQKSFVNGFESLLKSDGDVAEEWDIQIGKLIKTHPTNFLKTLKVYRHKVQRIDALLGNFGPELVDNTAAQKEEANSRIAALTKARNKSTDKAIIRLADECIAELKKY